MMSLVFEWTGREDLNAKGKRFHQVVQNIKIEDLKKTSEQSFSFVGFECQEGVRRNKGRLGAKEGPNAIRSMLASIPYHVEKENLFDIGNVRCDDENLEDAQKRLGESVAGIISKQHTPIILGGGHETFYGHYLGVREAIGPDKKIGMINLDAHFDMRIDETPSSGTMFRQILESDAHAGYLVIGIQELGNTEQLFDTAAQLGAQHVKAGEIYPIESTYETIDAFVAAHDVIIYTICTDVIDQSIAPGVSAPAPFGLDAQTVRNITNYVVQQEKFVSMDVSEVNPTYDVDNRTSRFIAYVLAEAISNKNK